MQSKYRLRKAKHATSLVKYGQSPTKNAISPVKYEQSPTKDAISPVKNGQSPTKDAISPVKHGQYPIKDAISPVKYGQSPIKDAISPVKHGHPFPKGILQGSPVDLRGGEESRPMPRASLWGRDALSLLRSGMDLRGLRLRSFINLKRMEAYAYVL